MDRESEWPLAEVRHPRHYLSDLVLAPATLDRLLDIAREVPAWGTLAAAGVPQRKRVVFYGPPGCGKTTAAEALAAEIKVPLVVVRVDAVISSYLGQTATNLRRIMEYANSAPWVMPFDEFDEFDEFEMIQRNMARSNAWSTRSCRCWTATAVRAS